MKSLSVILPALSATVMLLGCGGSPTMMRETGEELSLTLRTGEKVQAELICVQLPDSALLCAVPQLLPDHNPKAKRPGIARIHTTAIKSLTVNGFRNTQWPIGVLLGEVLPAVGLAGAAASIHGDAGTILLVSLIPAGLSAIFFAASGLHDPYYESGPTTENLSDMRKYARFGDTLSTDQVSRLLRSYQQESLMELR